MQARLLSHPHGFPERIDVLGDGSRQPGHDAPLDLAGDLLNGGKIIRGGGREPSFDHVHVQQLELLRKQELLLRRHREARRLLPIAQCRVEDAYVCHDRLSGGS